MTLEEIKYALNTKKTEMETLYKNPRVPYGLRLYCLGAKATVETTLELLDKLDEDDGK